MTAQVFAYKNALGINFYDHEKDEVSPAIINNWQEPGQLGCVADMRQVEFTQEAIDLLKTVESSKDAIGGLMLFKSNHTDKEEDQDAPTFAWMGPPRGMFILDEGSLDVGHKDYDASLLDSITPTDITVPPEFITVVEEALAAGDYS